MSTYLVVADTPRLKLYLFDYSVVIIVFEEVMYQGFLIVSHKKTVDVLGKFI